MKIKHKTTGWKIVENEKVETTRVYFDGSIADDEIESLKTEYGNVIEQSVIFCKPRISEEEAEDMKKALELLGVEKTGTWEKSVEPIVEQVKSDDIILTK